MTMSTWKQKGKHDTRMLGAFINKNSLEWIFFICNHLKLEDRREIICTFVCKGGGAGGEASMNWMCQSLWSILEHDVTFDLIISFSTEIQ